MSTPVLWSSKLVTTWREAMCRERQGLAPNVQQRQGLAPVDCSCLISELELFPVDSPIRRERFYTQAYVIGSHF